MVDVLAAKSAGLSFHVTRVTCINSHVAFGGNTQRQFQHNTNTLQWLIDTHFRLRRSPHSMYTLQLPQWPFSRSNWPTGAHFT